MTATAWLEQAACRGLDPELFYPDRGQSTAAPMAVCAACPVADNCAQTSSYEKFGIWSGTSERQRRRHRGANHGTPDGYRAGCHCGPCRVAYLQDGATGSPAETGPRACPECGGPIPRPADPERPTLFCSWRCGDKARRRLYDSARPRPAHREERPMTVTPIVPEPERRPGRRPPPVIGTKDCCQCGQRFSPTSNGSKYCSMGCSEAAAAARQANRLPKTAEPGPAAPPAERPDWVDVLRQIVGAASVTEITVVTSDGVEISVRSR